MDNIESSLQRLLFHFQGPFSSLGGLFSKLTLRTRHWKVAG